MSPCHKIFERVSTKTPFSPQTASRSSPSRSCLCSAVLVFGSLVHSCSWKWPSPRECPAPPPALSWSPFCSPLTQDLGLQRPHFLLTHVPSISPCKPIDRESSPFQLVLIRFLELLVLFILSQPFCSYRPQFPSSLALDPLLSFPLAGSHILNTWSLLCPPQ